jgi:hypothetical protein
MALAPYLHNHQALYPLYVELLLSLSPSLLRVLLLDEEGIPNLIKVWKRGKKVNILFMFIIYYLLFIIYLYLYLLSTLLYIFLTFIWLILFHFKSHNFTLLQKLKT